MDQSKKQGLVLVTGATGYIGGRLVSRLIEAGYRVRVLTRDPDRLQGRSWLSQVEVVQADVLRPDSLKSALAGVTAAYYLVHIMGKVNGRQSHQRNVAAARNFGLAAQAADIQRIVYLSSLGNVEADRSQRLHSLRETGEALRKVGVPVTEFRASLILGCGSMFFEMIRVGTERVPVMFAPRWVYTLIQPIAIYDVVSYLAATLDQPESAGQIVEIGGPQVLSYGELVMGYARERGLRHWLVRLPMFAARLSSYWVHWATPVPARIAYSLIEGLHDPVVVQDDLAHRLFPDIKPMDYASVLKRSLARMEAGQVDTSWSDALATSQGDQTPATFKWREGMFIENRQRYTSASAEQVYRVFAGLGGEHGWLYGTWLWHIRGWIDRFFGGVGVSRGRRNPDDVHVGDAVDFWRVEKVEPGRLLRLRAEMRMFGPGWLEFEVQPQPDGSTRLLQTAFYVPRGFLGHVYWYSLVPFHAFIFSGLIDRIIQKAEANNRAATSRLVPASAKRET
jgi:uncharacterized protein YbjT (DUF2867 family)